MKTMLRFTFEVVQAMPNFSLERTSKSVILLALEKVCHFSQPLNLDVRC